MSGNEKEAEFMEKLAIAVKAILKPEFDRAEKTVNELRGDVTLLRTDVTGLRTDLGGLRSDVQGKLALIIKKLG